MNLLTLLQTFLFLPPIIFHVVYTFQVIKGITNNVFKSYSHLLIHNNLVLHTEMTLNETKNEPFLQTTMQFLHFYVRKKIYIPFLQ